MHNHQVKNTHKKVVEFYNGFEEVFSLTYYDARGNVMERMVSSSVFKLTGYSKKEFEFIDFSDLYADSSERESLLLNLKKEGSVKNKILPLRKKSGELIFVSFSAEKIKDDLPEGCEFALKAILRDVTEFQHEKIRLKIAQLISKKSHRRIVNLNKLGEYIHEVLSTTIYFSNFYIATIDAKAGNTIFHYFKDDVSSKEVKTTYFERSILKNGFTEHLIKNSNTIIKDGEGVEKCIVKYKIDMRGAIPTSLVSIPLKNEGISEGVIVFQSYKKNVTFSKYDIEFLKLIAEQVSDVINRKYWQEKLIENEEYFRSLVDNSSEIIGIINAKGVIEYLSESVLKITGFKAHEIIGNNIIKELDKEKQFNTLLKQSENQLRDEFVIKVLDKKGHKIYLEISTSFLSDKTYGKRLIFNAKDITTRVLSERKKDFALKRLEILHQVESSLISDEPINKVLHNTLTVITENVLQVDRASISLFNYEKEFSEIIALRTPYKKNIKIKEGDRIPFNDLTSFKNSRKGKETIRNDLTKYTKVANSDVSNIKEGIVSYYIKPIVINNKVIGTFNFGSKSKNFFKNIDEGLINEIALLVAVVLNDALTKNKLTNLRNALNNTASLFYTDTDGTIISVNQNLTKISGYSEKELLGSNANILSSNYHSKEEWEAFWKAIKGGKTSQREVRNKRKDGTYFWVFQTVTPVKNKIGDIEQYISVQFDITEEKEHKNKLVKEVVEAQEKERERFAMEIHDGLGQLLLAAKMNMGALKKEFTTLDDDANEICNTSYSLVDTAIQEARSISHGLMSRVLNNYGLAHAVSDIISSINSSKAIDFKFEHNIKDQRFDQEFEMGVYRTLQELINNIIKHSEATKANLKMIRKNEDLTIKLKDNGVGIKKALIDNPVKGGIGLKNMRSRIEYLGGRFEINDRVKKGTEININIELKQ